MEQLATMIIALAIDTIVENIPLGSQNKIQASLITSAPTSTPTATSTTASCMATATNADVSRFMKFCRFPWFILADCFYLDSFFVDLSVVRTAI
jgi:hypothetical protein